ncbi:MAG: dockerin type I domain-containing protein [Oscillospiraceae bacterium]|nr:dockerin type I domain-containing protein [Oscillospiraceae bacterium]
MHQNKKKVLAAILAALMCLVLLVGGTLAWRDLSQHKTNELAGGDGNFYSVKLIDDFIPKDNWKQGETVDKKVSALNDGLTNGQFAPMFVRLQLKEFMEIAQRAQTFTPVRYMIDENGAFIYYATLAAAQSAYPNHTAAYLHDAIHNVDGWFIQTKADDKNGQYGAFLCTALTAGNPTPLLPGTSRQEAEADVNHQTKPNGECSYPVIAWEDAASAARVPNAVSDYVAVNLGTGVWSYQQWVAAGSAQTQKWVVLPDGYVYWLSPLNPGARTGNLVESLSLLAQPDGPFYYALHVDMDAVNLDDLGAWVTTGATAGMTQEILDALRGGPSTTSPTVPPSSGWVTIRKGDVNGDGRINNTDIAVLAAYLAGSDLGGSAFIHGNADMNDDGVIDQKDAVLLQELILNN